MSRDYILHKVRTAIGRSAGEEPEPPPPPLIQVPDIPMERRIEMFGEALTKLGGEFRVAASPAEAREYAAKLVAGKTAVASQSPFLEECDIVTIDGVQRGFTDRDRLKDACAAADVGITSADYALADTGSLVMLSTPKEARLVSLLPPVHLAIVPHEKLLTGLDELFTVVPDPAAVSSSMVLITGPSCTADIELILVRGVHGPAEVHVVLV